MAMSLSQAATLLAWPLGTKKSRTKWGGGSGTSAFKSARSQVYKKNELHSKRPWFNSGASCDMFVATCVRYCGYDKKYPPQLTAGYNRANNSKYWKRIIYTSRVTNATINAFKAGDIIYTRKSSCKRKDGYPSHVLIYIGNGYIAQASARQYYGRISSVSAKWLNRYKWIKVYRATSSTGPQYDFNGGGSSSSGTETDEYGEIIYGEDTGAPLVLENEIAQLYSSDNYKWVAETEAEESASKKAIRENQEGIINYLSSLQGFSSEGSNVAPVDVLVSYSSIKPTTKSTFKLDQFANAESNINLLSYPNLVEAPIIELSFNGITIGGYNNKGDKYPNYISSMKVSKINGRINNYTINLVYQIRAAEDPNFIDKLLSNTGYTNPLTIKYGDSNSPGLMFKEESAIITDVKSKDNVSSSSITYTIQAISSILVADKSYFTFGETTAKPSTAINNLLYNSGLASTKLLEAFPSMRNRSFVNSSNLIPSNDNEVVIGGMSDVSPLTYLSHIVSCMENESKNSSYFLTFMDDANGSYFKVSEICPIMYNNTLYTVDVGYPGSNFVTNFQLCDNIYWPLVYEYNGNIPKWDYNIDNNGNIISTQSNSLLTNSKFLQQSIINANWWKSLTEFPISAKLTLKGLTVPVMLMTYIRVNTLFFGQKDIASGIYVVTEQEDSISGSGYSTTLTLLRVSD